MIDKHGNDSHDFQMKIIERFRRFRHKNSFLCCYYSTFAKSSNKERKIYNFIFVILTEVTLLLVDFL